MIQACADEKGTAYLSQSSNLVDSASIMFNVIALIMRRLVDPYAIDNYFNLMKVRLVASLGLVFVWIQFFYWVRIFEHTAHYVDLILETASDIKYFMIVLGIFGMSFLAGFYMI